MRDLRLIALVWMAVFGWSASAQIPERAEELSSSAIVKDQPFSAYRFSRTVHVGRDGVAVTVSEGGRVSLARDENGLVFMAGGRPYGENCDLPGIGKLPTCSYWYSLLFDPNKGVVWHWTSGDTGDGTQYVKVDLRKDQIDEAERDVSEIKQTPVDSRDTNTQVQDLGEYDVEGIRAKGVRITTKHRGRAGTPTVTFREVWTSARMRLVVRAVDGDSEGDMVVSGLEHISLTPSAARFQPPVERTLRHWKDGGVYAAPDLRLLAVWLVR